MLILQEYNLDWEYIPGKKNIIADRLSRINLEKGTFEVEPESIGKIYYIIKLKKELQDIISKLKIDQETDTKLIKIRDRILQKDPIITKFFCVYEEILFIRPTIEDHVWKMYVPEATEVAIIKDYHERYGHMGPLKVIKALSEHCLLYTSRCV